MYVSTSSSSRENLLKTIRFEKPDYIPMTFHINAACWNYYDQNALLDLMKNFPGFQMEIVKSTAKKVDRFKGQNYDYMENYIICNCKQVSYTDIEKALENHNKMEDVIEVFKDVQRITHCSTGCGGCHDKVLDVISEIMMG